MFLQVRHEINSLHGNMGSVIQPWNSNFKS